MQCKHQQISSMRFHSIIRCRPIREVFIFVVGFTILSYYTNFYFSIAWWKVTSRNSGILLSKPRVVSNLKRSILSQQDKVMLPIMSSRPNLHLQLEKLFFEIEDQYFEVLNSGPKFAHIFGEHEIILRDLPIYLNVLTNQKFFVNFPQWYTTPLQNRSPLINTEKEIEYPKSWHLLICFSCLRTEYLSKLNNYQKVNQFPGLQEISLCSTFSNILMIPAVRRLQFVPICHVFPSQRTKSWKNIKGSFWISRSVTLNPEIKVLNTINQLGLSDFGASELKKTRKMVLEQLLPNVFHVFGQLTSVRFYVLVTSFMPFRAYIHTEGLIHHHKNFRKMANRTWLLRDLWRYLAIKGGMDVMKALSNLHSILIQIFLVIEGVLRDLGSTCCRHCFQLLGVDVFFNSSFSPIMIEINGQPNLHKYKKDGQHINKIKHLVINDMIKLLSSNASVAREVAEAISKSCPGVNIVDLTCHTNSKFCLNLDDIKYILESRREKSNQFGFTQLYPSPLMIEYEELIKELAQQKEPLASVKRSGLHGTSELYQLLLNLERYYNSPASDDGGVRITWNDHNVRKIEQHGIKEQFIPDEYFASSPEIISGLTFKCSEDPDTLPYIRELILLPDLNVTPAFSPSITEYTTNVPYELTTIQIGALPQNCQAEVRIDDTFVVSKFINYTLGIGSNRISLSVVDVICTGLRVINTYYLIINRLPVTYGEGHFYPNEPHEICSLKQECEMQVFPNETCGIHSDIRTSVDWSSYLGARLNLPVCASGDASGRWMLPCRSCNERKSCFWKKVVWHPYKCRYVLPSEEVLSQCLSYKKILFIGDSTNRGMMHYLMEKLNGSLTQWDKTHNIKVYTNVNFGRIYVSFAYYPQFWLPVHQRPVFDKALYQLIQRENLYAIRLVVKTLGSGFHQPVEGIHILSMNDQRKLFLHNTNLIEFAKHNNFEVVNTFNITVPRYKDFLQGKCACHFHRVAVVPPFKQSYSEPQFHVEGDINAVYSNILLSRLCSDYSIKR